MESYKKRMLKDLKEKTTPTDATELIKFLLWSREHLSKEGKEIVNNAIEQITKEHGEFALLRAFAEELMTESEWLEWKARGWDEGHIGNVLGAYFADTDIKDKDGLFLVTMKNTIIYRDKKQIKDKFGVNDHPLK